MGIFRIKGKVIPDGALLNLVGKKKGVSFNIMEHKIDKDTVSVLVRGEVRVGLRKFVDEEWVVIDIPTLADQFCIEKYGRVMSRNSFEWKREYIRAKLVATRYAVGLAKKRIEARFTGEDFRDLAEKEAEKNELTNIYLTTKELQEEIEKRRQTRDHLKKIKQEDPNLYKELEQKFGSNLELVEFRTPSQSKTIHALLKEKKVDEKEYRKLLKERFGISSSLGLTKKEASELISILKSAPPQS